MGVGGLLLLPSSNCPREVGRGSGGVYIYYIIYSIILFIYCIYIDIYPYPYGCSEELKERAWKRGIAGVV